MKRKRYKNKNYSEQNEQKRELLRKKKLKRELLQRKNENNPHLIRSHRQDNLLAPVAQDFVCAPASRAYVEHIFSVCGILCSGRRSSTQQSLEMRACLKLNHKVLCATGFAV